MALPVTITSAVLGWANFYAGPFKAPNQAIYVVGHEGVAGIHAYKATDPTSSFSQQDGSNNPVASNIGTSSYWSYISGSEIHIVTNSLTGSDHDVEYHVFDTASDTWTTTDEEIEAGLKDVGSGSSVSVAVRSDGDVIVLYNGDPDSDMGNPFQRVDYARREGGSWTTGVDVGGTSPADEDRIGSVIVRGSADNMHFFWYNPDEPTTPSVNARTLNNANSLSTPLIRFFGSAGIHAIGVGIAWLDGSTWRTIVTIVDGGGSNRPWVWRNDESSGDLATGAGAITQISDSTNDATTINGSPVICLAVDGDGEAHAMWSHDPDLDLYRDSEGPPYSTANWGTDVEEIAATTINRISCNVYPRDGAIKLAFVYDEAGDIKYNEVSITAPTAPAMADSRFPDQNYKIGPFSV